MTLNIAPEQSWVSHQVIARGWSGATGYVTVAFYFRAQAYEVSFCSGTKKYNFDHRRAALSFAAELCEE